LQSAIQNSQSTDPDIRALTAAIARTEALLEHLRSKRDDVLADLLEDEQALDYSVMRIHDEICADAGVCPPRGGCRVGVPAHHPVTPEPRHASPLPAGFIDNDPDGMA
jgi:hypothetical protein